MENRISELRKKNNITQQNLADIMNVSRQTIISLEKGKYNPSISLAFKISRYFKSSIEDVFIFE